MFSFRKCQLPVRHEPTEGSSFKYTSYRIPQYEQRWLHSLHEASIKKHCVGLFRYSDRLSRNLQFGVAKNVRDVLRQWTPREKYVKYQTFLTRFG